MLSKERQKTAPGPEFLDAEISFVCNDVHGVAPESGLFCVRHGCQLITVVPGTEHIIGDNEMGRYHDENRLLPGDPGPTAPSATSPQIYNQPPAPARIHGAFGSNIRR